MKHYIQKEFLEEFYNYPNTADVKDGYITVYKEQWHIKSERGRNAKRLLRIEFDPKANYYIKSFTAKMPGYSSARDAFHQCFLAIKIYSNYSYLMQKGESKKNVIRKQKSELQHIETHLKEGWSHLFAMPEPTGCIKDGSSLILLWNIKREAYGDVSKYKYKKIKEKLQEEIGETIKVISKARVSRNDEYIRVPGSVNVLTETMAVYSAWSHSVCAISDLFKACCNRPYKTEKKKEMLGANMNKRIDALVWLSKKREKTEDDLLKAAANAFASVLTDASDLDCAILHEMKQIFPAVENIEAAVKERRSYTNAELIEALGITKEEQKEMDIFYDDIAMFAAHEKTRKEKREEKRKKVKKAIRCLCRGMKYKSIAQKIGWSLSTIKRLAKKYYCKIVKEKRKAAGTFRCSVSAHNQRKTKTEKCALYTYCIPINTIPIRNTSESILPVAV